MHSTDAAAIRKQTRVYIAVFAALAVLTLVTVGASLMIVAILAVLVPAIRAMRVDPVVALRAQ